MEEKSLNDYISNIQEMIRTGNPKYMPYISREYVKYLKVNPMISDLIETILYKEVNLKPQNPYSIFLDDDGTINMDSISDISKITDLATFITQVENLSKFEVDFKDMTSEELIIEGEAIVEELEKELEKENISEEEIHVISEKADNALKKIGIFAGISTTVMSIFSAIKDKLIKVKNKKDVKVKEKEIKKQEKQTMVEESFVPKVDIDEEKAINDMKKMKARRLEMHEKNNYGDGDPDGDDIDL